jgi:hypothetical protein
VRLPEIPLIFYSKEFVKEMGKYFGVYYDANRSYTTSGYMGMVQILVGINL